MRAPPPHVQKHVVNEKSRLQERARTRKNNEDIARCVDFWHVCRHCIARCPIEVVGLYITKLLLFYNGSVFIPIFSQVVWCHTDSTTVEAWPLSHHHSPLYNPPPPPDPRFCNFNEFSPVGKDRQVLASQHTSASHSCAGSCNVCDVFDQMELSLVWAWSLHKLLVGICSSASKGSSGVNSAQSGSSVRKVSTMLGCFRTEPKIKIIPSTPPI